MKLCLYVTKTSNSRAESVITNIYGVNQKYLQLSSSEDLFIDCLEFIYNLIVFQSLTKKCIKLLTI